MAKKTFSPWTKWKNRDTINSLKYPGIYALSYSSVDISEKPFSFTEDVKYIGMTNSQTLKLRLKQFNETVEGLRNTHGGADRMRFAYQDYKKLLAKLYVSVLPIEYSPKEITPDNLITMGEVAKLEFVYFAEFLKLFGDLPMFNRKTSLKYSKQTKVLK